MSRVFDHLADLTGQRDRDVLDVTLVGALKDLLRPEEVAIYRCVGDEGALCWLTRACLGRDDTTARADSVWSGPDSLPALHTQPDRHACLQRQEAFEVPGSPHKAYFPLATELQTVGVLELTTLQALTIEDMRLVGSILRIYRNFQGLLDYSERDTLTGLLNRKTFDESFLRICAPDQAHLGGRPHDEPRRLSPVDTLWLAVIDIDHFKRVNDEFGHLIGDEVLLLLSRLMRSSFRFHDHLYRFGGEEFVVLMRCGDDVACQTALERMRHNVQGYRFPQVESITVSIGFTELRATDTPSAAFDRADRTLYHVKQNGRNQVANYAALVRAGHLSDRERDSDVELF